MKGLNTISKANGFDGCSRVSEPEINFKSNNVTDMVYFMVFNLSIFFSSCSYLLKYRLK